ncbi:uncharacterized protein si:ch211-195b21.5 isoform X4 [Nerophis ophidion]|uniref:uncharacterized protein si:ch211-195b21.5 isoform X4 n=1 Tax=Nerophis ophidion TaxID=159077 RepID=UPI002AE06BEB|nr:uncharacterized protein si:ch211-195b21.5 isoform X4 [Nerophis ophidion]
MYRPGQPAGVPRPFGVPQHHNSLYNAGAPCLPPGHFPPAPCGTFSSSPMPGNPFLLNSPPGPHPVNPHCSSFPMDPNTAISAGGSQPLASPTPWNPPLAEHRPDNSARAGEEFLRCIAQNKPLPDYLKGNMACNLADALKSANILKEAVKSDRVYQKHLTRSKSRSRSRSRGRSRGKSRCKSRGRSRSKGRSKSCVRGKSRARSRSRSRSKKNRARSKSRHRRSTSQSSSSSKKQHDKDNKQERSSKHSNGGASCSNSLQSNSLLEGLKLVMNNKDLEERLPTLKDAVLTIQASDKRQEMQHHKMETSTSSENESMVLPHDRVGSDFSWLQPQSQMSTRADEYEDEESFLYGNEDATDKISATLPTGDLVKPDGDKMKSCNLGSEWHFGNKSNFSISGGQLYPSQAFPSLDNKECEKLKNILKGLHKTESNNSTEKTACHTEGKPLISAQTLSSVPLVALSGLPPQHKHNLRQAFKSLQSLIKVTREKREKSEEVGTSQSSCTQHKSDEETERNKVKQSKIHQVEVLMREVGTFFKEDGFGFLSPVIGFYCQMCEEFIGDLNDAESHAAAHCQRNIGRKTQANKHSEDAKQRLSLKDNRGHSGSERGDRGKDRIKKEDDYIAHRHEQKNPMWEEIKKERMLITVSRCVTSPNVEEQNKDLRVESHAKVREDMRSIGISSEKKLKDAKEKHESSDDSHDDKQKVLKEKSHKKKKDKKNKKKKNKS